MQLRKIKLAVVDFLQECEWSLPMGVSLGNGSTPGSNIDLAKLGPAVGQTATTTCEIARALCKPVDDLTKRGGVFSHYTAPTAPPMGWYQAPQYAPVPR